MKISIEGIDNTGKTTLAKHLKRYFEMEGYRTAYGPSLLEFYNQNQPYGEFVKESSPSEIVNEEMEQKQRRDDFLEDEKYDIMLLDRGDLTLYANAAAHFIYENGRIPEEGIELLKEQLGEEELTAESDLYIYLDFIGDSPDEDQHTTAVEYSRKREDADPPEDKFEFLETAVECYSPLLDEVSADIIHIDARKPFYQVLDDVIVSLEDQQ